MAMRCVVLNERSSHSCAPHSPYTPSDPTPTVCRKVFMERVGGTLNLSQVGMTTVDQEAPHLS